MPEILRQSLKMSNNEWEELMDLYEVFWNKCSTYFGFEDCEQMHESNRVMMITWGDKKLHMRPPKNNEPTRPYWRTDKKRKRCVGSMEMKPDRRKLDL